MNSLSWLLYWAAVVDNIGGSLGLITILFGIAFLPCTAAYIIVGYAAAEGDTTCIKATPFTKHLWRINIGAFLAFMLAFTVVPDKKTIYAIAASEVGGQIVKSEAVKGVADDATKALQQWIKNQIEPPKKEKKAE